jgi:hypothetical protein
VQRLFSFGCSRTPSMPRYAAGGPAAKIIALLGRPRSWLWFIRHWSAFQSGASASNHFLHTLLRDLAGRSFLALTSPA